MPRSPYSPINSDGSWREANGVSVPGNEMTPGSNLGEGASTDAIEIRIPYSNYEPQPITWRVSAIDSNLGTITIETVPAFDDDWIRNNQDPEYGTCGPHPERCATCQLVYSHAKAKWEAKYGPRPDFSHWLRLWENIGLYHTAAIYMLEVHYNGKEHKFDNAHAVRAAVGL